jgi:ssDNA-binding Zn-finger/Zn-ribbon topoisomerase 1
MWFDSDLWEYQTCPDCGYWWNITVKPQKEVKLHLYAAQPWMNHIAVRCPECRHKFRLFAMKRGAYRRLLKGKAGRVGKRFASAKVVADFERQFGINTVKPRLLTPRQEKVVAFYREMLDREHPDPEE